MEIVRGAGREKGDRRLFCDRGANFSLLLFVLTRFRYFRLVSGLLGLVAFNPPATAGPPDAASAVRLAYHVPAECPSEAEFVAAVSARGSHFDGPAAQGVARGMDVAIRKDGDGFAGSFKVRDNEVPSGPRDIHAATCADVMDGLAVVTAIALRGNAEGTPPRSTDSTAREPAPPATPSKASGSKRLRKIGDVFTNDIQVNAGTLAFKSVLTLTASGGAVVGVIPSLVLPRYDLNLFRGNFVTTPSGQTYLVGPILRARVSWLGERTYRSNGFSTNAQGFSFGMSGCRAAVYDTRGAVVLGCLEYAGGVMTLDTRNAEGTRTQLKTVGLGTVGAGIQSQYNFGAYFHVDLNLGLDVSLSKLTAERPDGSEIFHSQPFSGYAVAGIGVQF